MKKRYRIIEKIVSQGRRFTDGQVTDIAGKMLSILSYLHGKPYIKTSPECLEAALWI